MGLVVEFLTLYSFLKNLKSTSDLKHGRDSAELATKVISERKGSLLAQDFFRNGSILLSSADTYFGSQSDD